MTDLLERFNKTHVKTTVKVSESKIHSDAPPRTQDDYLTLHNKCMDELNKIYVTGLYEYIRTLCLCAKGNTKTPTMQNECLYSQLEAIEAEIDLTWGTDIEMFKKVLRKYYHYHKKIVSVFLSKKVAV